MWFIGKDSCRVKIIFAYPAKPILRLVFPCPVYQSCKHMIFLGFVAPPFWKKSPKCCVFWVCVLVLFWRSFRWSFLCIFIHLLLKEVSLLLYSKYTYILPVLSYYSSDYTAYFCKLLQLLLPMLALLLKWQLFHFQKSGNQTHIAFSYSLYSCFPWTFYLHLL